MTVGTGVGVKPGDGDAREGVGMGVLNENDDEDEGAMAGGTVEGGGNSGGVEGATKGRWLTDGEGRKLGVWTGLGVGAPESAATDAGTALAVDADPEAPAGSPTGRGGAVAEATDATTIGACAVGGTEGLDGKNTLTVQALKTASSKPHNRTGDFLIIRPF